MAAMVATVVMVLTVSTYAITARTVNPVVGLSFQGTTAVCHAKCFAGSDNDNIQATLGVYFLLPAPDKIASSLNAFRSFIPQQVGGCGTSPRKYRIRAGICWVSTPDSRFCIQHHCPE